jgi:hypothetical protein
MLPFLRVRRTRHSVREVSPLTLLLPSLSFSHTERYVLRCCCCCRCCCCQNIAGFGSTKPFGQPGARKLSPEKEKPKEEIPGPCAERIRQASDSRPPILLERTPRVPRSPRSHPRCPARKSTRRPCSWGLRPRSSRPDHSSGNWDPGSCRRRSAGRVPARGSA